MAVRICQKLYFVVHSYIMYLLLKSWQHGPQVE